MTRCTWRDCAQPATCSLGFGRHRGAMLFAPYCEMHAREVELAFRVEARNDVPARSIAARRGGWAA